MHARNLTKLTTVAAVMLLVCFAGGQASGDTIQVNVPGTSNPWLAGQPTGSSCCGGDVAPAESPVGPIAVAPGQVLTFSASGAVTNGSSCTPGDPQCSTNGPDGGAFFTVTPPPGTHATNGIAGVNAPLNALVGVFLDNSQPDPATTPASLDFGPSGPFGISFGELSPGLRQPFFIGDGLTGIGTGTPQLFHVPAGATRLFLGTIDGLGWANNLGSFTVQVSGVSGTSELTNLSTRGVVGTGNDIMIGGLIIQGNAPKTVLLRGRGPSLSGAPFFIPGTLPNPLLQVFSGSTLIAQNNNWQDAPNCGGFACGNAAQILATGLDPCQPNPGQITAPPNCILESAILITLPPGAYTAQLLDAAGSTGVGLVEAFDVDANVAVTLHNLSSRGVVGTGNNIMIGGFIINGTAQKTVLVRGRGPSLSGAPFSIPGTLSDPFIQVFSGSNAIAQNNNWQDAPNCLPGTCGSPAQISATGLDPCVPNPGQFFPPPNCTLESAILITLAPGAYTVQLSGVAGQTGVGLVEIFEVQ